MSFLKSLFGSKPAKPAARPVQPAYQAPVRSYYPDAATSQRYVEMERQRAAQLAPMLYRNFPDCQIRQWVPASEFSPYAHPKAKPISFMLYRNGVPVLALNVALPETRTSMPVVGTKRLVEACGIPYYCHYRQVLPKAEAYIIAEIRKHMR